jgi:hypothetical protein
MLVFPIAFSIDNALRNGGGQGGRESHHPPVIRIAAVKLRDCHMPKEPPEKGSSFLFGKPIESPDAKFFRPRPLITLNTIITTVNSLR